MLAVDAQVRFSGIMLGREPRSATELLMVYAGILAHATRLTGNATSSNQDRRWISSGPCNSAGPRCPHYNVPVPLARADCLVARVRAFGRAVVDSATGSSRRCVRKKSHISALAFGPRDA